MKKLLLAAVAGVAALAGVAAVAQTSFLLNNVTAINPDDVFQDVVHAYPTAQSKFANALLLGNYSQTTPGGNPENALIGGDASTNLWQRGTAGTSQTTSVLYGGPDRWAYWSGASTAVTVLRGNTAADLPTSYQYDFQMQRTSGQTGVVQTCMLQEVESVNSYQFAGQTAELDFHASTGSNYSAASANMTAYIITGTGADEGVAGTSSVAFGLNAGGGGSGSWTGQVNWAATVPLGGVSNLGRYTVAAPIPAATTEIAVALCFTPVGTAGTNDYVAFSGIQLVRNSALTSLVKSNASGTATFVGANDLRAKAFARRTQAQETAMQQRYYYQLTEGSGITPRTVCHVTTAGAGDGNGVMQCPIIFPVTMRIAPTATFALGFAGFTTTAETTRTVCKTSLVIDPTVTFVNSTQVGLVQCSLTSSTIAVGLSMTLVDDSGSGAMKYSSEL